MVQEKNLQQMFQIQDMESIETLWEKLLLTQQKRACPTPCKERAWGDEARADTLKLQSKLSNSAAGL